jgi:hypothetical protein
MLRLTLVLTLSFALASCVPERPPGLGGDDDTGGGDDDDDTNPGDDDDDDTDPGDDDDDDTGDDDDIDPGDICDGHPGEILCDGDTAVTCDGGGDIAATEDCDVANDWECREGLGCVMCEPGALWCEDNDVMECAGDGGSHTIAQSCDVPGGEVCDAGACVSLCALAEVSPSNSGCMFYGVDMEQYDENEGHQYAITVVNPNEAVQARIDVELRTGAIWNSVDFAQVAAGGQTTFELDDQQASGTALVQRAAYRVSSNIPINAYQFNPLEAGSDTSDASLLLPTSALQDEYRVTAWGSDVPGFAIDGSQMAIVAGVDGTQVVITPSVHTALGPGVPAGQPGVPMAPIVLDEGDVLQVINDPLLSPGLSLEGTVVEASADVAVFGGHVCANVPHGVYYCDHVEEAVFGLRTWGTEYVGARLPERDFPPEIATWHFQAGDLPTTLTFSASNDVTGIPGGNTLVLAAGAVEELEISGTAAQPGDFVVTGTEAFSVTQFMTGGAIQDDVDMGDPCMTQTAPLEQFREDYVVTVPNAWDLDHLTLTRAPGEIITVGGQDVDSWPGGADIAGVNIDWEVVRIEVHAGSHILEGSAPFGVMVSGMGDYDSYCFPGGLDQAPIN